MTQDSMTVETFAASLPDRYLTCRELGHTWKPYRASFDTTARAYDRELRCTRCHTSRTQVVSTTGHVLANHYRYPNGYLTKHVEDAMVSRDVFRLESLTRYLNRPHRESA
jgi:hypothetical protein